MGGESFMTHQDYGSMESTQCVDSFALTLRNHGLELKRTRATILQVNVGALCNLACKHCHLEAGPHRSEVMDWATMEEVVAFATRGKFDVVDITGGAPELNPNLTRFIEMLSGIEKTLMIRSNLVVLTDKERRELLESCRKHRVAIVGSLPSLSCGQLEAQRGTGVQEKSFTALKELNAIGYGLPGSGLTLDLVSNPSGAFLPPSQLRLERKFRFDLEKKKGIVFNGFYAFANVPLGRFRRWLIESGNFDQYMQKLASTFNPCAVSGLMCRNLVSVSWDGYVYDCDFNLAAGIPLGGSQSHVSELAGPPAGGDPIAVSDHCYTCTAGSGFT